MSAHVRTLPTGRLQDLIRGVRASVRAGRSAGEVAGATAGVLRRHLTAPDLLSPAHCLPDPARYRQHVLHVEPDGTFSIVSLVWLPGQSTPIHDHVSWCVVGVHRGCEFETRYELVQGEVGKVLREVGRSVHRAGTVAALTPPGDIHRVENRGPGLAVSIHIYGADIAALGSSIRRQYDLPLAPVT